MLKRDPHAAAASPHELIIIGGGIYGACLALEAACRGLRPLLLERDDFGQATSWNSLRILHGGLRYLQRLDVPRWAESTREQAWFRESFPELVRPLPCLMPIYNRGLRRRGTLRAAFLAETMLVRLARVRRGAQPGLPRPRVVDAATTTRLFPAVARRGLRGGAVWCDLMMTSPQRLLVEILRWAAARGARVLNYVEAAQLAPARSELIGVLARDRLTDAELTFRAPLVVNCAGPWCGQVAERLAAPLAGGPPMSLAFNLLLDKPALSAHALAVAPREGPAGANLFLLPLHGRILAGTYHAPASGPRPDAVPSAAQVREFLAALNAAVPGLDATSADVVRVCSGLLPTTARHPARPAARPLIHDHGAHGGPRGLYSVSGVKYTTARAVAEAVLQAISRGRGRALPAANRARPAPAAYELELDQPPGPISWRAGGRAAELARLAKEEAVIHLDDLVLRRTDWWAFPDQLPQLAAHVAEALGWEQARRELELERLRAALAPVPGDGHDAPRPRTALAAFSCSVHARSSGSAD